MELEHRVEIRRAYDCTNGCEFGSDRCSPGSGGFHGIVDARIEFAAIGPKGAIVFSLFSQWYKPETVARLRERATGWMLADGLGDVAYHAREPIYPDSDSRTEDCGWLGAPCYYDGSGLQAQTAYAVLTEQGSAGLWDYLTAQYASRFGSDA